MNQTTILMVPPVCYPLWRKGQRLCKRCGKIPMGRRRVYCDDECERVYDENHYWSVASYVCKERAGWRCEACARDQSELRQVLSGLEAHHIIHLEGDRTESCYNHQENLVCLCTKCHGKRHTKPKPPEALELFDMRNYTTKEVPNHRQGVLAL